MIKFAYLVKRAEGMSFEEFVAYHREKHAPLFASIPEAQQYVRKYTISHPVPAPNYPEPAYDGLTEIWFDDWAGHDAFFGSQNYRERVQPDEPNLLVPGAGVTMVTEERQVI